MLDAAGAVMMCTRPVLELLGGSAGELRGRELGSFLEDPSEWAGLAESAGHGRRSDGRVVLRRVGGGRVDVDVSVFALAGGGGARFLVWLVPVAGAELEDRFGMRVALAGGGVLASSPRAQQRLDLLHAAAVRVGGSLDVARNAEELVDLLVPVFADLGAVDLTEEVLAGEELGEFSADAPMRRVAVAAGEGMWPEEVYGLGETFSIGDVEREHLLRGSARHHAGPERPAEGGGTGSAAVPAEPARGRDLLPGPPAAGARDRAGGRAAVADRGPDSVRPG
ncbi:PAS domain-containing protein [Streptomyces radiopugnans]|nr:PAS domain-containing protein [Streptomyces radiopugnans]